MKDLVVVSMHENGFFQADLYRGASGFLYADIEDAVPDEFFTAKKTEDLPSVLHRVAAKWPNTEVRIIEDLDDSDFADAYDEQ